MNVRNGLVLCLLATVPAWGEVLVVRASSSAPDEAERNYAASLTRTTAAWLEALAVPHRVVDDVAVAQGVEGDVRTVVLPYNPFPPAAERRALKRFLDRGGKLLVFYGADEGVAEMMGMRLGAYKSVRMPGRWSAIRFRDTAPPHLPHSVRQTTRNIRPVYPVRAGAKTIADWVDDRGKAVDDPAVVQSDHGFWMTHVLRHDEDARRKQQMLLGMLGACDPSVWPPAATACAGGVTALASELKMEEAYAQRLRRLLADGQYAAVVTGCIDLRQRLTTLYAGTLPARLDERRGVWDHSGLGLYPGDWQRTCDILARHGITDLFVNVLWPAEAHFKSGVVPPSEAYGLYGDQLAQCLAAAKPHGIRVHAWKVCWKLNGVGGDVVKRYGHAGRLQLSDSGATVPWLCPSNDDNLRQEKDALRDLVRQYAVDGVHLDYIRYNDRRVCYCATCRTQFERDLGRAVKAWPADPMKAPLQGQYVRWRCGRMTRLVRDVRAFTQAMRPGLELSAAVFGKYPSCVPSVGQDWVAWVKDGLMDFVCPMNYTDDPVQFRAYVRDQVGRVGDGRRILAGIGVTAAESRLDAVQVIDQVRALREEGAGGYVLFDLNREVEHEILGRLGGGFAAEHRTSNIEHRTSK